MDEPEKVMSERVETFVSYYGGVDVMCSGARNLTLTFSLRSESFCDSWTFLSSSCEVSSRALVNSASRADTQAAS